MIRERKTLYNAELGESADEIEIARPLTNKELEEKLYELTDIVKRCVMYNSHILGTDLVDRLNKLQENLS